MTQYDFDDKDDLGFLGSIGPKAAFFIVLIALSFMVGLVWKLYAGGGSDKEVNVPIVRADTDDYKVKPDDPGGMEIPYQDSTLFNREKSDSRIENLLAEDTNEPPVPRSQLFAGLSTEEDPVDLQEGIEDVSIDAPDGEDEERIVAQAREAETIIEDVVENGADALIIDQEAIEEASEQAVEESKPVVPEKVEPVVAEIKPEPAPEPTPAPPPVPKAAPKPTPAQAPVASAPSSGNYYIQLASVQSKPAADAEWQKFVKKYAPHLDGYSYRIETADLGDKGVYHRIQAGPTSKARADETCSAIKRSDPNGCLVKAN